MHFNFRFFLKVQCSMHFNFRFPPKVQCSSTMLNRFNPKVKCMSALLTRVKPKAWCMSTMLTRVKPKAPCSCTFDLQFFPKAPCSCTFNLQNFLIANCNWTFWSVNRIKMKIPTTNAQHFLLYYIGSAEKLTYSWLIDYYNAFLIIWCKGFVYLSLYLMHTNKFDSEKSCKDFLCITPRFIWGRSKSSMKRTPEVFPGTNKYACNQGKLLWSSCTYGCFIPRMNSGVMHR